ncbi:ABC transporter permease [Treponema phagedenis]|nr:ABC transporter permease [Treponema phagedenis]QEJ99498.1 ABC transporter permease [Treponema phagedenis]QEK05069.1 ABC transporter permease [Treponema phagedenis]QEK10690.1 ABC transporter permease [Treponema phagedenis]QSH94719.1 ABC transporter permease [Treponema phagedenis]QSI00451.1 ABC transporter permease [Treponema phagedenis]
MLDKKYLQRKILRTEFFVFIAIIILSILIQLRSGQFFSNNNLVDLVRAVIIPAMFSIAAMIVLVSGGTDVSAPSIASLAMYLVSKWMLRYEGNVIVLFLIGAGIGIILGCLNGYLIARFQFPTLIVTLGTASLYTGLLQGVFAAHEHPVPAPMHALGKAKLFSVENAVSGLKSNMPLTIFLLIALVILVWFILQKTMLGRGIYAIGGDVISAQRAGFNVFQIQMFIYIFVGMIAGITGVARASMMMNCQPTNLNGMEMTAIASCVLGGTSVQGGAGSITGTILGVLLITIISNSLLLLGISTFWQKIFTGLIILIGTGVSAYRMKQRQGH